MLKGSAGEWTYDTEFREHRASIADVHPARLNAGSILTECPCSGVQIIAWKCQWYYCGDRKCSSDRGRTKKERRKKVPGIRTPTGTRDHENIQPPERNLGVRGRRECHRTKEKKRTKNDIFHRVMVNDFSESEKPYSFTTYRDIGMVCFPVPIFADS